MAVDILLNSTGDDIDLSDGVMRLTPDMQTVSRQQALISLRMYLGEWAFNIGVGIPYLKNDNNTVQLLGAGNNKSLADSLIKKEVLKKEFITEILTYESEFDKYSSTVSVTLTAKTKAGEVVEISTIPNQS